MGEEEQSDEDSSLSRSGSSTNGGDSSNRDTSETLDGRAPIDNRFNLVMEDVDNDGVGDRSSLLVDSAGPASTATNTVFV